jgi:hydrogenase small subunit
MTRRQFIRSSAGTVTILGFSLWKLPRFEQLCMGAEPLPVAELPLIWMATGSCTGCSVTLLNAAAPTVRFALVGNILPDKRLSLGFHTTLMAAGGYPAMHTLDQIAREHSGGFVLVIDGATAAGAEGLYCTVGESDGEPITGYDHVRDLGRAAKAVLAVGSCAAFGGIPAARPNPTDCLTVRQIFDREGIRTPLVNIPGCPPHPDWIIGTIATLLLGGVEALRLDAHGRPAAFFSQLIHDNCPYRGHFERGEFAQRLGEHGCLLKLGCKGPITHADCPLRRWNNATSWCVQAGHPCIGCCEPGFPAVGSLYQPVEPAQLTFPASYPPSTPDQDRRKADADTYTTVGLIGLGGFLAGLGTAVASRRLKKRGAPAAAPGTAPDTAKEVDNETR